MKKVEKPSPIESTKIRFRKRFSSLDDDNKGMNVDKINKTINYP